MTETQAVTKEQIEKALVDLREKTTALKVNTADDYKGAGELIKGIKAYKKNVEVVYEPILEREKAALDGTRAEKKAHIEPADRLLAHIDGAMLAWEDEQKRLAKEEQARRDAELKQKAEDLQLAEANLAEAQGDHAAAEKILAEPVNLPPAPPIKPVPKVAGLARREVWDIEVTDPKLIVADAAAGKVPSLAVVPDEVWLRRQAVQLGDEFNRIYRGVRAFKKPTKL